MQAVSIGPLVLAGDRLAAIIGIAIFLIATSILSARVAARIGRWSSWALLGGLAAARLGHVIENGASFATELWRVAAVWQGGFSSPWGAVGVAAAAAVWLRTGREVSGAVLALALALFSWNVVWRLTNATPPTPLPNLTLRSTGGEEASLTSFRGRPMVLNMWASWCPPCRREMPMMAEIAAERQDVTFLFVNQGEGGAAVERYLESANLTMQHVLLDPRTEVARNYAMPGLPATLFIGADGVLRSTHVGEISREALTVAIARLVQR